MPRIGRRRPHRGGDACRSRQAARAVLAAGGATLGALLTGGEDYEVLATVPVARADDFERLAQRAGVHVTCIGSITASAEAGVRALDESGNAMVFTKTGWDHFQSRDVS